MPAKLARSDPQSPFGRLEMATAVGTAHPVLRKGRKRKSIHASSAFIRVIPDKTCSPRGFQREGAASAS